jgi:Flp pilus assembly protein TadD
LDTLLPQAYLIGLVVLLGGAAVVVGRQIWRVRRDELALARLDRQGEEAPDNLKRALKRAEADREPAEAQALIQNALGFALAAQNNYKTAIRHYRSALAAKPDYPVALNNLAFALEKQRNLEEAEQTYRQVLELDASNKTARKRLQRLERSFSITAAGTDAKAS